jgi:hypothetical protein
MAETQRLVRAAVFPSKYSSNWLSCFFFLVAKQIDPFPVDMFFYDKTDE